MNNIFFSYMYISKQSVTEKLDVNTNQLFYL